LVYSVFNIHLLGGDLYGEHIFVRKFAFLGRIYHHHV